MGIGETTMEPIELNAETDENFVFSAKEAAERVKKLWGQIVAVETKEIYKKIFEFSGRGEQTYCCSNFSSYIHCSSEVMDGVKRELESQGYTVTANLLERALCIDWRKPKD